MLRAFLLSVRQLGDRAILAVLAKSLAVTIALFVGLGFGAYFAVYALAGMLIGSRGEGTFAALVAVALAVGSAWLLFRIVGIAVIGFFADDVVAAVEARHYPAALASARSIGPVRSLKMGLGSGARALVANLVMLPVYLALLITGVGLPIAFFVVNGWLLGRDLGDMVAVRHMDDAAMRGWRKATGLRRFGLGLAATGLFVVPLLNILAPILSAAMATHLFHGGKQ